VGDGAKRRRPLVNLKVREKRKENPNKETKRADGKQEPQMENKSGLKHKTENALINIPRRGIVLRMSPDVHVHVLRVLVDAHHRREREVRKVGEAEVLGEAEVHDYVLWCG
jgi:hypothetical protein